MKHSVFSMFEVQTQENLGKLESLSVIVHLTRPASPFKMAMNALLVFNVLSVWG